MNDEAKCARCYGTGLVERPATPDEVDDGCELGVAYDTCDCAAAKANTAGWCEPGKAWLAALPIPDDQKVEVAANLAPAVAAFHGAFGALKAPVDLQPLGQAFLAAYVSGADLNTITGRDVTDDDQVDLFAWFLAGRLSAENGGQACTPDRASIIRCHR